MARPYHAAVLEHPANLSEGCHRFLHVFQHAVQKDGIERAVGKGQGVEIRNSKTGVRFLPVCGLRPGKPELAWLNVDTDHVCRRDEGGEVKGDGARTAATVQQGHARLHVGEEKRGMSGSTAMMEEVGGGSIVADRIHVLLTPGLT